MHLQEGFNTNRTKHSELLLENSQLHSARGNVKELYKSEMNPDLLPVEEPLKPTVIMSNNPSRK